MGEVTGSNLCRSEFQLRIDEITEEQCRERRKGEAKDRTLELSLCRGQNRKKESV